MMERRVRLSIAQAVLAATLLVALVLGAGLVLHSRQIGKAEAMAAAAELMDRSIEIVSLRADAFIAPIETAVGMVPDWPEVDRPPTLDGHPARHMLAALIESLPQISSVLLAYDTGDVYLLSATRTRPADQLERLGVPDGAAFLEWYILREGRTTDLYVERFLDAALEVLSTQTTLGEDDFDPRTRPWFEVAQTTDAVVATDVYTFAGSGRHGLTLSRRHATGVVGIDVTLDELDRHLREMPEAELGVLVIFDDKGEIVARSLPAGKAEDGREAVLEALVADALDGTPLSTDPIRIGEAAWIAREASIDLGAERQQRVAVAMPVAEIVAPLTAAARGTALVSLLILAAGLPLLWLVARLLSRPLIRLAAEAEAVRRFDLELPAVGASRVGEIRQLERAMAQMRASLRTFALYVPKALVKQLVEHDEVPEIGGERRDLTVLFMDLENFTSMAADLPPEAVMERMSRYFETVTRILLAHEATIDKYIGDAVMAFWNAPLDTTDHAARACAAALAVVEAVRDETASWTTDGMAPVRTRIGIHSGPAIVGNVGSSDRMNYTALGATVNLASRLEQLNRELGTEILASADVVERVRGRFVFEHAGSTTLKGFAEPIHIFALIARSEPAEAGPAAEPAARSR
ncbi:MAG: adenylate/guanylate cyclase domain-containing protein [Geminicoccaceae bacterium]